jgi:beta-glucosidase
VSVARPEIVVVLMNGSTVAMPWVDRVKGIVEGWLGGQAGGGALADVLAGRVNPSGKLSETFPLNLEQTPTHPNFPARHGRAEYGEGLFIGYRYYDKKGLEPLFPFGFGLSYTRFTYTGIRTASASHDADAGGDFLVEVAVQNVGAVAGREVVQLYVRERRPRVVRPERELRAFAKLALEPGEQRVVRFALDRRAFAHYDPAVHDWVVDPGTFDVLVGGSSRDLPLRAAVEVHAAPVAAVLTRNSMIKAFRDHPRGRAYYEELVKALPFAGPSDDSPPDGPASEPLADQRKARAAELAFAGDMPVGKLPAFSGGAFSDARLDEILRAVAAAE